MFIAAQKKKENIAEYLLYMWQIEDLIRANKLDMDAIQTNIIDKYQITGEQKKELTVWYENLIEMMRGENIVEKGHLQINNNVIIELTDVHIHLLNSNDPMYNGFFAQALPVISELKSRQNSTIENEVEVCFSFLYGVLLLKLQKKEISKETEQAIQIIRNLLALLTIKYKEYKEGKLSLE